MTTLEIFCLAFGAVLIVLAIYAHGNVVARIVTAIAGIALIIIGALIGISLKDRDREDWS